MSGKLEGMRAINTSPLTNHFCIEMGTHPSYICSQCYSKRMLRTYRQSCAEPWRINGELLALNDFSNPNDANLIPHVKDDVIRYHGHGELINRRHLANFMIIALYNPNTRFVLYTKRDELFNNITLPDNMKCIYSSWFLNGRRGVMNPNPHIFSKIYTVYDRETADNLQLDTNCEGKCRDCMLCYSDNDTEYINAILK